MTLRVATLDDESATEGYPFDLATARAFPIDFSPGVTVFVGENGSGKSTPVEVIAVAAGFKPEGGSGHALFETEATHSVLADHVRLRWRDARRLQPGWFLRAESFYNVATDRDPLPDADPARRITADRTASRSCRWPTPGSGSGTSSCSTSPRSRSRSRGNSPS